MVFVPVAPVAFTVIVPVNAAADVGVNVTTTTCDAPGAIVPLAKFPVNPVGYPMLVTTSAAVPELVMVRFEVAVLPTETVPNERLPVSPIVTVEVGAVGVFLLHAPTNASTTITSDK
jgi:hypothetical protein